MVLNISKVNDFCVQNGLLLIAHPTKQKDEISDVNKIKSLHSLHLCFSSLC